jgi:hypothetical protein
MAGRVIDELGDPVAGATVRGHGGTVTTDANGFFMLKDRSVPQDRCFVVCSATGYFNGAGAATPRINGATPIEITLVKAELAATVDSDAPETIFLEEGGEIDLPPGGFQLENGTPYNGEVQVLARQLDPDSEDFGRLFPGDILAQRTSGSEVSLLSYGVIIAELRGSSGQKLQLASGRSATLTFPIPASMESQAPASMPLWYFDESLGKWKEEGSATRSGDSYVGEVRHFTPWNCDDPFAIRCFLDLHVVTRLGKPAGGVRVRIGQVIFITDANGDVHATGTDQATAQVPPELNFGIGSDEIDVSCSSGQSNERTLVIDGSTVSGMVIDCDGRPIPSLVYATWGTGQTNYVASPGLFNMLVPAGQQITVHALGGSSRVVGPLSAGDSIDIGSLVICPGGGGDGPDFGSMTGTITVNGQPDPVTSSDFEVTSDSSGTKKLVTRQFVQSLGGFFARIDDFHGAGDYTFAAQTRWEGEGTSWSPTQPGRFTVAEWSGGTNGRFSGDFEVVVATGGFPGQTRTIKGTFRKKQ